MRTVLALRVTLLALQEDPDAGERLIHRLFRLVWVEDGDPEDPQRVARCCDEVGLDGAPLVARAGEPAAKAALFASTTAALEAGVFGAPTFVVDPDGEDPALYWGNDRLPLLARGIR